MNVTGKYDHYNIINHQNILRAILFHSFT